MLAFHFTTLASTNTTAKLLALRHPETPLLVSSRTQTAGRGREGRVWVSPLGGAWFTVAWPVNGSAAGALDAAPLVVGQAVLGAIEAIVRQRQARASQTLRGPAAGPGAKSAKLEIKWPNDLLVDGRKLAGILCERIIGGGPAGQPGSSVLLIGVGINVNIDPAELGNELRYPAASLLQLLGEPTPLGELIADCAVRIGAALRQLELEGFTAQHARQIESRLAFRGQRLAFRQGQRTIEGLCLGLDETGRLLLQVEGTVQAFSAGEIHSVAATAASATM